MSRLLGALARILYRPPSEMPGLTDARIHLAKGLLFVACFGGLSAVFSVSLSRSIEIWTQMETAVAVPLSDWKVLYESADSGCGATSAQPEGCAASPLNPKLWESAFSRKDASGHSARTVERKGQPYWLGARIPAERLQAAARAGATFLGVGSPKGDFRIWVDGEFLMAGGWTDLEHVSFPLSLKRLESGRPLHVAVQIVPNVPGLPPPDSMSDGRLGPGFMTKATATGIRRLGLFWSMARPLALFVFNFCLALVFFALWWGARERQENLYMALFALAHASIQLRAVDLLGLTLDRGLSGAMELLGYAYFGVTGMATGLAFARVRRSIFLVLASAGAIFPLVYLAFHPTATDRFIGAVWMDFHFSGPVILLGALACAVQAAHLYLSSRNDERPVPARARHLALFALGLVSLTVIGSLVRRGATPSFATLIFSKGGPYLLLAFLGRIAFKDHQLERQLARQTPVSSYHRRNPLPDLLRGAVLMLDLKGSEQLFREGSRRGVGGEYVSQCLSAAWSAVSAQGGLVLSTEGDALLAFFESGAAQENASGPDSRSETRKAAQQAVLAAQAVALALRETEQRLRTLEVLTEADGAIRFRAGMTEGAIRPIWREVDGGRHPGWVEAGSSNPFVDSARLMDLERKAEGDESARGRLVVPEELSQRLLFPASEALRWDGEPQRLEGKHGKRYPVRVLRISPDARSLQESTEIARIAGTARR